MTNLFGEFFGTLVLISFGCGVNANLTLEKSYAKGAGWICTTAGWAFGVMIGAFAAISLGAPQAEPMFGACLAFLFCRATNLV